MAKLAATSNPEFWAIDFNACGKVKDYFQSYMKKTDDEMGRLRAESDRIHKEGKTLVGLIVSFGVADGYATYRVVKDKPLTLEHIPHGDAWQIPAAHLRGLTAKDIRVLATPFSWRR